MNGFYLLISIVPRGQVEFISKATLEAGATGGTILMGFGTARSTFMQILGLGEKQKDIVLTLVEETIKNTAIEKITEATQKKKAPYGVVFTLRSDKFIRSGKIMGGSDMESNFENELIVVIVNKGFADDVMAVARNAGARGGTVLNARGTANADSAKFFGVQLVPEKETILILAKKTEADKIIESIKSMDVLSQKGVGVAFTCPACDFVSLGTK